MNRVGLNVALCIAVVAGLVLGFFPQIDLRVAQILGASEWAPDSHVVREFGFWVEIVLMAAPVITLIIKLILPHTKMLMSARAVVFLIVSLMLGPGLLVNVVLKDHWGRPRPGHIVQSGGDQRFVAWWDPGGECQINCSFVSGEAASAFWTIAPAALAPKTWRPLAYGAALVFGIMISVSRITRGGHFLSDTIFAGVFTFLIIWVMYAMIYRWQRTRLDDKAVEDELARFSIYCRTILGRLMHSKGMPLLIGTVFICLGACAQSSQTTSPWDLNSNLDSETTAEAKPATEQAEKEVCTNASALAVGMTTSQVVSSCGRTPLRTQEVITKRDSKHQTIWSYKNLYLEFENGKLAHIRPI